MRVLPFKSDRDKGVVHGDIKPQNVLVYKDAITGKITVKVADFGYSTLTVGGSGTVFLPKSRPWNAPEHHFGEFNTQEAKKTDVYSFGMLCLWFLFGDRLSGIPQTTADGIAELISFNAHQLGPPTFLELLKGEDKVEDIANNLVESMPGLNVEYRIRLKEVFSLTLSLNPGKRTCDLARVIDLLTQKRQVSPKSQYVSPKGIAKKFRTEHIDHPPTLLDTVTRSEFSSLSSFQVGIVHPTLFE